MLNDSGCSLGNTDLYDTGLDEEEESLEAIRAAVKQRMNNLKVPVLILSVYYKHLNMYHL